MVNKRQKRGVKKTDSQTRLLFSCVHVEAVFLLKKKNSWIEVRQLIASSDVWHIPYNLCSELENLDLKRNYTNQNYPPSKKNPP